MRSPLEAEVEHPIWKVLPPPGMNNQTFQTSVRPARPEFFRKVGNPTERIP